MAAFGPGGNSWDPSLCNHGLGRSRGTTPVTKYKDGASPYGVMDMAGNVWEWCADGFDMQYHSNSSKRNPVGTGSGKVIRGGCWYDEYPELYRCAVRDCVNPDVWEFYRGFRCVKDVSVSTISDNVQIMTMEVRRMSKLIGLCVSLCAIMGFPLTSYGAYLILFEAEILSGILFSLAGLIILGVGSRLIDIYYDRYR